MGCVRFIYNWALALKIQLYKESKKPLSYVDIAKLLTRLKKTQDHKWLNVPANECLQQSLRCLDTAYNNFFKHNMGFPKFKSKNRHQDAMKFINNVKFDFETNRVKVPKIGWVKFLKNQTIPKDAITKTLTIKRDACGTYWATIVVNLNESLPPKAKVERDKLVGIDMGVKNYVILSNGTIIPNPKYYHGKEKRLAHLQKDLDRKVKGSHHYKQNPLAIAKLHRSIHNERENGIHQLTSRLVKSEYTTFCLEDLNIQGMEQNHHLAKSISDASWGEFKRQLLYKCKWAGKNVLFCDRFDATSKTCHNCGYVNKELTLNVRDWVCPKCGEHLDRDINAAINIKDFALKAYSKENHTSVEDLREGIEGRGYEPCEVSR